MTKKEAFNAAARLLLSFPVDCKVFIEHFKKLEPSQREELTQYIQERLNRWPLMYDIGSYQIKRDLFSSDYYSSRRGFPYRPVVYQLFGGLIAVAMSI